MKSEEECKNSGKISTKRKYEKEPIRAEEFNNGNFKNTLEKTKSSLDDVEERINNFEDRPEKITQSEQLKEKKKKKRKTSY